MLLPRRRDEHFEQIAELSSIMLQGNLNTVKVENIVKEVTARYKLGSKYVYSTRYVIESSSGMNLRLPDHSIRVESFFKCVAAEIEAQREWSVAVAQ